MRAAILGVLCFLLTGCSVFMAASGHREPNLGAFGVGSTRGQVEQQMGPPKMSLTLDRGRRQDLYEYVLDGERSPGRAIGHGIMDVLTLGLWELIGTPIEVANLGEVKQLRVTYGADGKVVSLD